MEMSTETIILQKLESIEKLISEQNLLQKQILNFNETCIYLDISQSHLYKLTSTRQVPHFCPQGKKLYFNRQDLDTWLQRNRQSSQVELENQASNFLLRNKRKH